MKNLEVLKQELEDLFLNYKSGRSGMTQNEYDTNYSILENEINKIEAGIKKFEALKDEGYFIEIQKDTFRGWTNYTLRTKEDENGSSKIMYNFNFAGFQYLKNNVDFEIKEAEVSFLNVPPFAEINKTKTPLKESFHETPTVNNYF